MKRRILLGILICISGMPLWAQTDSIWTVVFYNVENLFHPSDDSLTADEDFTPTGLYHWNYKKYYRKINLIAKALLALGKGHPPEIVGLAEIEGAPVLKDLCYRSPLKKFGYRYVHHDSPDRRGVDVALLYRDTFVQVLAERAIPVVFPFEPETRNRDLLYVLLLLPGDDSLHVIVNHWTSRYGGYAATITKRNYYADRVRALTDSILLTSPKANILVMGDFNDYPTDESLEYHLRARRFTHTNTQDTLFNLMLPITDHHNEGSHKHEDFWGCLDQIILSRAMMLRQNGLQVIGEEAHIFAEGFLLVPDEKYGGMKNYRTFLGPRYIGGFSDHLPVYIKLKHVNSKKPD